SEGEELANPGMTGRHFDGRICRRVARYCGDGRARAEARPPAHRVSYRWGHGRDPFEVRFQNHWVFRLACRMVLGPGPLGHCAQADQLESDRTGAAPFLASS